MDHEQPVIDGITGHIHEVRGMRVMLDADLAGLYGVPTKRLNEQVSRNAGRFPADFMLRLSPGEIRDLRSQIATSSRGWGGRRYPPLAFSEQGVAMLSSVLNSERAIRVNIEIMRAFVRLRQFVAGNAGLTRRLDELEKRYDGRFRIVFQAIRQLMTPPEPRRRRIGFRPPGAEV